MAVSTDQVPRNYKAFPHPHPRVSETLDHPRPRVEETPPPSMKAAERSHDVHTPMLCCGLLLDRPICFCSSKGCICLCTPRVHNCLDRCSSRWTIPTILLSYHGKAVPNGDLVRFESKGGTMTSLALVFRGDMVNIRAAVSLPRRSPRWGFSHHTTYAAQDIFKPLPCLLRY